MRDLPGIYKESKHALFISALHHTSSSSFEMFQHFLPPCATFCVPTSSLRPATRLMSHFADSVSTFSLLFKKKKNDIVAIVILYVHICCAVWRCLQLCAGTLINPIACAFCSQLHFWNLMRAKPGEGWPVFVCLWAKCQRMCCVCLSRHRGGRHAEGRRRLGVAESARRRCQVSDPAGQVQRSADPPNWTPVTWAVSQNTCTAKTRAAIADVCKKYELVLLFFHSVRVTAPSWRSRLAFMAGSFSGVG